MKVHAILPLGADGVLIRFADVLSEPANRAALAFRAKVAREDIEGVIETASSLTSVFVRFRPDQVTRTALTDRLRELLDQGDWSDAALPVGRKLWHIPVAFEGENAPDLAEVAELVGVSPEQAISDVTSQTIRVLALGFAPGQPYLGFLPERWNIPRRSEVTPQVPRGAVVVAVRQVIPFANPAPTGWRQIGRTAFRCYDPAASPALPLSAGDEVRFQSVSSANLQSLVKDARGGAEAETLS